MSYDIDARRTLCTENHRKCVFVLYIAELKRMTNGSVATCLTLSRHTSICIQCDRSAQYKDKGIHQTLVIDLIY